MKLGLELLSFLTLQTAEQDFFIISSYSSDDEVIVTSFLKITKTIMVFLFKKLLNYYFKVAKNME